MKRSSESLDQIPFRNGIRVVRARSAMLLAAQRDIVRWRLLPKIVEDWENPIHEESRPRNAWSMLNVISEVLKDRQLTTDGRVSLRYAFRMKFPEWGESAAPDEMRLYNDEALADLVEISLDLAREKIAMLLPSHHPSIHRQVIDRCMEEHEKRVGRMNVFFNWKRTGYPF
jgi:hypothetical protein